MSDQIKHGQGGNSYRWLQAHQRSILFFLLVLAIAGLVDAYRLPVALFPNVDFPRVMLNLDSGDRPAEQMEIQVTVPVEDAIRRVPGVRNVRSTTSRGSAEVSITFAWGTDMAMATVQIAASINQIMPLLPANTRLLTRRMDPTVFPMLAYSLTDKKLSPTELYDLAQYQLRPLLSSVQGVARVQITGGAPQEYRVTVDPARLGSYGLALSDVSTALAAANVLSAVGRLEDHYKLYLLIADNRLSSLDSLRNIVVKAGDNGLVRLSDVATMSNGAVPQWIKVRADGEDAVLLNIYQQPGSNSVQIVQDIKTRLAEYQSHLPASVKLAQWYDQSQLVIDSATSVRDAIFIGIGLAVMVLLVFLRNIKLTLIALIVVPSVLASTVVLLHVLGLSFNIMTLGGMAAAVGLIIDDAIVMIEHIVSRTSQRTDGNKVEVMEAASEFLRPLLGSSASTILMFLPLAFLSGITGEFFRALALTMVSGLTLSLIVTWAVVPLLAAHLLSAKDQPQTNTRFTSWLHQHYERTLSLLFRQPLLVLLMLVPLVIFGGIAYQHVDSGFMPAMDEGGFILDYRSAPGTSLTETDRLLRQVEAILKETPEVSTYSRRTGVQLGDGLTEVNEGDFLIRLHSGERRHVEEIMDQVREKIAADVPGLDIELVQLMEDLIGDLTAVPQPIEVKIFSDNEATLIAMADKTAKALEQIPGIVDVRNNINPAGDALQIHVDKDKAALEGIDADLVSQALSNQLAGNVATEIRQGPKMVGVRVWIPQSSRNVDHDISKLLLRAPDGHMVPVSRIASIDHVSGQPQISRENLKRMVAVTAHISGTHMGTAITQVKQVLDQTDFLSADSYYELGGLYKEQQIAFNGLVLVMLATTALIFLLMLYLYERFRIALAIMSIPVLSIFAVFIGLYITGIELNISALMGVNMVLGIVTEVAIFFFSEYAVLTAQGISMPQALIQAGKNRMRPITMTTMVTILTLLPLAMAWGTGAEMQQPLAVAIIAGLVLQLPLILLLMPLIFHVMQRREQA